MRRHGRTTTRSGTPSNRQVIHANPDIRNRRGEYGKSVSLGNERGDQFRKAIIKSLFEIVDARRPTQTKPRAERMRVLKRWYLTAVGPIHAGSAFGPVQE
jgi:hypothetical protein